MDLRKTDGSLQQKAEGGAQEEGKVYPVLLLTTNMANWPLATRATSFPWLLVAPYPRAFAQLHI